MKTTSVVIKHERKSPRARVHIAASVLSEHFYAPVEVECTSLSSTGMFLAADLLLDPGERLTVSFTVPGTQHRVVADAVVVRAARKHVRAAGLGLHFDRLPSLDAGIVTRAVRPS
jgi:hypothetical protein